MSGDIWPPQCSLCHKLMALKSLRKAVAWTPYGSACDYEPPPEQYAHRRCWDAAPQEERDSTIAISWLKPMAEGKALT